MPADAVSPYRAILSKSFDVSLKQLCACIRGANVRVLGIREARDVLHRWDDIQPLLFRANPDNNLARKHLFG
jgi:hypothetical protein